MAFITGAASSPTNLLDSLAVALSNNGWTVLAQRAESEPGMTAGYNVDRELYVLSPAGGYFQFAAHETLGLIMSSGATGFNIGSTRNAQPGHSSLGANPTTGGSNYRAIGWAATHLGPGPYAQYYFFITDQYCHVAVEVVINSFRHFMSGNIRKAGPFVGGEYYTGTRWSFPYTWGGTNSYMNSPDSNYNNAPFDIITYSSVENALAGIIGQQYFHWPRIHLDVDGHTNRWVRLQGDGTTTASGFIRSSGSYTSPEGALSMVSRNDMNGLVALPPAIIMAPRPIGGTSIYGTVRDIAPVEISQLEPKQVLTYGSDEWMVFPLIRKGTGTYLEQVSGNYGLAYKIVP